MVTWVEGVLGCMGKVDVLGCVVSGCTDSADTSRLLLLSKVVAASPHETLDPHTASPHACTSVRVLHTECNSHSCSVQC